MSAATPIPLEMILHQATQCLELVYETGERYSLSAEFLRVYSPSAEVRGHHPSQAVLQTGKRAVKIMAVEPVGHYAVRLVFDDGHASGLYSWPILYDLAGHQAAYWQDYLHRLEAAGASREP